MKLSQATPSVIAAKRDKLTKEIFITERKVKQGDGSILVVQTERRRGPATANRYLAALSHAFTIASSEWNWTGINPCSGVRRNKEAKGRVRYLTEEERPLLLEACKQSRNEDLYTIVLMDISCGGRAGEVLPLTWQDVSFELKRIIFRDTKNGETRAVPLVGECYDLLKKRYENRRNDSTLVFPSKKNPAKPMSIRTAYENAVRRAGITDFHFHDLRHTNASYLAMNGATIPELAAALGHKTLQMVKRYAHLSEMHTLSVVEKMNAKYLP